MKDEALKNLLRECSAYITEKTQDIYNLVPGYGDPNSKIMLIAPYPSAKEEESGVYFDGKAGGVFDAFLAFSGLRREEVYTTYTIKYRPYQISERSGRIINRDVTFDEIRMFYDFLVEEVELIAPKLIITLGELPYSALHNMEQDEGPEYGELSAIRLGGVIYNLLPLMHPSQAGFDKSAMTDKVREAMDFLDTIEDILTTDQGQEDVFMPLENEPVKLPENAQPKIYESLYNKADEPMAKRKKRKISGKHKVILIYGGTGLINDPTSVVADRISHVLAELNVTIDRIDLYKKQHTIRQFLEALEQADGVILATTVTWFGIGGLMQTFLDQAYQSGQFEIFEGTYLYSVAISQNAFERDALDHLIKSWEILGGIEGTSLCAAIESSVDVETNKHILQAIERRTEDFYRVMNQQRLALPTSVHDHKILIKVPTKIKVDEGEQMMMGQVMDEERREKPVENQMSFMTNYDAFIEKQQKDIEDLANIFRTRLSTKEEVAGKSISEVFQYKYKPDRSFKDCTVSWVVNDQTAESFMMHFSSGRLSVKKGRKADAEVVISSDFGVLEKISKGRLTIQRAFMTGEVKAKGNFTLLYKLDQLFAF